MARINTESLIYQAVTNTVGAIDRFLSGEGLHLSEVPAAKLRQSIDNLVGNQSASVRTACLFLTFYKDIEPSYVFDSIPVGSRGAAGDKLLCGKLKERHITLSNITSYFENIGSKGNQGGFNLLTDPRFVGYTSLIKKAEPAEVKKAALYLASLFAASQKVPPALPALSADTLSYVRARILFKSLIEAESGGYIPQFLVASLLKQLRAKQNITVETHHPNAADRYDGTAGDIEEFIDGRLYRAYEVTVRDDWKNRLGDFKDKMDKAGLTKYIIIASGVNRDDELREPAAMALKIEPLHRDIAVMDIVDFTNVMCTELSAAELRQAVNGAHEMLVDQRLGGRYATTKLYTDLVGSWLDKMAEVENASE
jgi:hypothetical protein